MPGNPAAIRRFVGEMQLRLELPQAVRETIRREFGSIALEDLEREAENGKVVYEAIAEPDGEHEVKLFIAEDGRLLNKEK